jgi:hypothetical protein
MPHRKVSRRIELKRKGRGPTTTPRTEFQISRRQLRSVLAFPSAADERSARTDRKEDTERARLRNGIGAA